MIAGCMIRRRWCCWLELCHVIVTFVSCVTQCHEPRPPVAKILRVSVWCCAERGQGRAVRSSFARFLHGAECGAAALCGGHSPRFAENLQCGCCCVRAAVLSWTGAGAVCSLHCQQQPIAAQAALSLHRACPHPQARHAAPPPGLATPHQHRNTLQFSILPDCDPAVQIK